jgi:hypothetical protein
MGKTTFRFWINWDGTGVFSADDEVSDYVIEAEWFLGTRETFRAMADDNTANLTLINTDGRFNPSNPSSPLYGNIKPFRAVKIEADYGGTIIPLWTGYLDLPMITWQPIGELTGKHTVSFSCVGIKQIFDQITLNFPLLTNTWAHIIITDVFFQGGFPGLPTDFETGATKFDLYGDNGADMWQVIQEISESERGWFWMDRDGTFRFWNRHHKIVNTAVLATLDSATEKQYGLTNIEYRYGEDIANSVRVSITPRRSDVSQTLWELDKPMTIQPSTTEIIEVRLRKLNGQFVAATSLSVSSTFSSGTANITIAEKGGVAVVTIQNVSTAVAVLDTLTLTGVPTQAQNSITVKEENTTSINELGRREIHISLATGGGHDGAKQIALYELSRRDELRGTVRAITLKEVPNTGATVSDVWKIGERYRITIDSLFVDDDYWCVGERHQWRVGNEHVQTCYLEPAKVSQFWLLGVVGQSEISETTRLVY